MKIPGLIFLVLISLFFLSIEPISTGGNESAVGQDSLITVSVAVMGDLMCHSVQYNYARVNKDSFDFIPVYRYVKDQISAADFAFGNFETVTAGKKNGFSGYPFFNSPDEFISSLKNTGFDLLTTSNNHSLDRGEAGLLRTIDQITLNGMGYNGTFRNSADRDSIRIYDIKGISVAFLAYSYGTNGLPIPKGKNYLINLIDTLLVKKDIEAAKIKKPDVILVHYHFGEEYKRQPSVEQKQIVKKTIEYGADIIIGGHPHVIQPLEFIPSGISEFDSAFVIYSMGNFISNQRWRYSDAGVILKLNITKNFSSEKVYLESANIIPTWVYRGKTNNKEREFVIIPNTQTTDSIDIPFSKQDKIKMQEAFKDTREMLQTDRRIY